MGLIGYEQASAVCRTDPEAAAPRRGEFAGAPDQLKAEAATLKAGNTARRGKVQALEEKAAKDSDNSSKPPSSDGLSQPKPKSLRPPSNQPTGGQPGHPGQTLRLAAQPDRTVRHPVESGSGCGRSLGKLAPDRVAPRQVFDLPEPKLVVTEHPAEVKTCACGCLNRAAFPPEAAAPVQYGPRVKSAAVYRRDYQLLPSGRLTEIMRDLLGCESFSEGTLANFKADCSRRLEPVDTFSRDLAAKAEVAGFEATGGRATGSLHWLHTVSTHGLTWYFPHQRRGCEAMNAANFRPNFRGRAVHDFRDPYLKYDCNHAFCQAHLWRGLIFLWQEQKWAKAMIDHLVTSQTAVNTARDAGLGAPPAEDLDRFHRHDLRIVEAG